MKAILEFDLNEEMAEFQTAVKASDLSLALHEVGQRIFRPARKHGYPRSDIQELLLKLDKLADKDAGIAEDSYESAPGGTELVGKLETMFYEILAEYDVSSVVG